MISNSLKEYLLKKGFKFDALYKIENATGNRHANMKFVLNYNALENDFDT